MYSDNIVLIGMPGAGKSTIGVVLAKAMGYHYLDTDLLIQEREEKLLHEILKEVGVWGFNKIEEEVISTIKPEKTIIATGGSAVYGAKAMDHLRNIGTVVYIKLPYETILKRVGSFEERGIALKDNQSLEDIYKEREPLYKKYAHVTIETEGLSIRESMDTIKRIVRERVGH